LTQSRPGYALGYANSEQERLIRQASRIAPFTERLFREAGIAPGARVLELGSGMGDVAMLVAALVGPAGEVVGVERDPESVERAQARVAAAGLANVSFIQADLNQIDQEHPFDAAVGRFILMFLPDPLETLRRVVRLVRPGGVLVFQEPSWVPLLALGSAFPLWSNTLEAVHNTFVRSGVNPEMGLDLFQVFQKAGLPAPAMKMEVPLGHDEEFCSLICGLIGSVEALARRHGVALEGLGDLETLSARVHAEIVAANRVVSFVPLVGAWSRKPEGKRADGVKDAGSST
jgi:SAM-dependent methyltransferase